MANEYLYGAYGHVGDSVAQSATQAGTTPVYVGTAPVNLIRDYAKKQIVNYPVKISNYINAQKSVGIADDWSAFTLCEAISAHFDNSIGNIGPIYLINVLDPDVHRKDAKTSVNLTFSNGRAVISSSTIILDTLALDEKVEGVDYNVDYNFTSGTVLITSADASRKLTGTVVASFDEVDVSKVTAEDIIGGATSGGVYTGLGALQLLYQEQYQVCNLIAAPTWSEKPEVYNAMLSAAQKINGHWDAFVAADIPLTAATIEEAKSWKKSNGYTNERSKVFWPKAKSNTGKVFNLSTLAIVEFMRADYSHNSVPMETCGNKKVAVVSQYFGKESNNRGFDQKTSEDLTSNGISTVVFWGGNWVLWGDHTAAYAYGADVDPRCIFDVSMRMLFHITNSFQREWGVVIDEPFTRQLKDRILNKEQEKLDGYVAMGALMGHPEVLFLESENSTTDMMNGDFRWDIPVTPTPPLKSASVYVAYSDSGFSSYFEE